MEPKLDQRTITSPQPFRNRKMPPERPAIVPKTQLERQPTEQLFRRNREILPDSPAVAPGGFHVSRRPVKQFRSRRQVSKPKITLAPEYVKESLKRRDKK